MAASLGPTRVIHVHHGLVWSDLLEAAARKVAQTLGIHLDVLTIEVHPWSEGRARKLRYQALMGGLKPSEWLLTGHTADDQAETVFANLLRGAGVDGLAGIPVRRPPIARPLLGVDRSTTRELATLAGLAWIDDPTNLDLGPLRNRLRLRLLPQMEAEYNPSFRRHLVDVARALSALDQPPIVSPIVSEGEIRLPVPMLMAVNREVAIRSIRAAVRSVRDGYSLTRAENERVWKVAQHSLTSTELAGGIRVAVSGPWLVFTIASRSSGDGT
jgi:tRNA(Ile)-lysidine synthetase-like protein